MLEYPRNGKNTSQGGEDTGRKMRPRWGDQKKGINGRMLKKSVGK